MLARLAARVAAGERYPELVARVVMEDPDDPAEDEVHVYLEKADRTGTHAEKHLLGRLPARDAIWVAPLIRLESDAFGTGPVLRYHVSGGMAGDVRIAISRAHEAAAAWLDWADDRAAWADAHAVAEESPYAYRTSYRDTMTGEHRLRLHGLRAGRRRARFRGRVGPEARRPPGSPGVSARGVGVSAAAVASPPAGPGAGRRGRSSRSRASILPGATPVPRAAARRDPMP